MTDETAESKSQDYEKKIDETLRPEAVPAGSKPSEMTTSSDCESSSNGSDHDRRLNTLVNQDQDSSGSAHVVVSEINCERNYCLKNRILYNKIIDNRYALAPR